MNYGACQPPSDTFEIDFSQLFFSLLFFYLNNVLIPISLSLSISHFQLKIDNHSNDAEIFRLRKVCNFIESKAYFNYNFYCVRQAVRLVVFSSLACLSLSLSLGEITEPISVSMDFKLFLQNIITWLFWGYEQMNGLTNGVCNCGSRRHKKSKRWCATGDTNYKLRIEVNCYHQRVNVNRHYLLRSGVTMMFRCYN